MNQENLGKIHKQWSTIKIVTYLDVSILFIDDARSFLAGWVSAPAEVLILATWVRRCKASNRRLKTSFTATKPREQRGAWCGKSSVVTWSKGADCLCLKASTRHFFFGGPLPKGAAVVSWLTVEGQTCAIVPDPIRLGTIDSAKSVHWPASSLRVKSSCTLWLLSDTSASTERTG
jgi:hypothetical protein